MKYSMCDLMCDVISTINVFDKNLKSENIETIFT